MTTTPQEFDSTTTIEIFVLGDKSKQPTLVAELDSSLLDKFTKLKPSELKENKLSLKHWISHSAVRTIQRWMISNAFNNEPNALPCPQKFPDALALHEATTAMGLRLGMCGREVVNGLIQYLEGGALTLEEFEAVIDTGDQVLRRAAIAGTEARYQDGRKGGFEGVPERREIAAYAARKGITMRLG